MCVNEAAFKYSERSVMKVNMNEMNTYSKYIHIDHVMDARRQHKAEANNNNNIQCHVARRNRKWKQCVLDKAYICAPRAFRPRTAIFFARLMCGCSRTATVGYSSNTNSMCGELELDILVGIYVVRGSRLFVVKSIACFVNNLKKKVCNIYLRFKVVIH